MKNIKTLLVLSIVLISFAQCEMQNKIKDDDLADCAKNTWAHTLTGSQTAATVPASTIGMHNLTLQYAVATSPYPDGTKGEFEVTADNKLIVKINNHCVTLSNPYQSSPSEVVFVDDYMFHVIFGVSEKSGGGLNEINMATIGTPPTFLGQFHN